ncbi:hypothetical protein M1N85_02035, partial [Dehalococcoidia bacterium]|nr:hypothetical protein [Dehalococcoidia bacterium]
LCRSKRYDGLIFDYGVHISFTSDEYVKDLFARSVNGNYEEKQVSCMNYWRGYWIKHQAQNNLHSLPKEVIKKCLIDFIRAKYEDRSETKNYRDWCYKAFGEFFAENFVNKYTKKFWTVESHMLTTDWIEARLHQSDLEIVIDGALGIPRDNAHYITTFRYPKEGGYASFLGILKTDLDIKLKTYPIAIDLEQKEIHLNTGEAKPYNILVSAIPLPELIKCIKNVPRHVLDAANSLKWTSLLMLDFYIGQDIDSQTQWNYYYDEEIPYSRAFYMSKFAESNASANCETVQIEIPYSRDKPLTDTRKELMIEKVVQCIHRTENIALDKINYLGDINIEYGYVIYDIDRKRAVETIHSFLDDNEVYYCGRFGEWAYLWSDQALLSGRKVAENVVDNYGKPI